MIIHSYAKLNLFLEILKKRSDGYHTLNTVFERIDLHDDVSLKSLPGSKIEVKSNSPLIPENSSNLAYKAANILRDFCSIKKGVSISILKRIPIGAGLGGGSSNAASVLNGLNELWKLRLSLKQLTAIGEKIGADVPFFIYNCSFALAKGRGDKIQPLPELEKRKLWHVVAVPDIRVSTPFIYGKWDKLLKFKLTKPSYNVKILILKLMKSSSFSAKSDFFFNSLEQVSEPLYPVITSVKQAFHRLGAKAVLMSGSGPAVFGIMSSYNDAVRAAGFLRKNKSLRVFVSRTV